MNSHRPDLPPCIVLGLESQIGLNLVRELADAGVRVIGIAQDSTSIGLRSNALWRRHVVAARSPALLALLRQLGVEHGPCPLLAIAEVNLLWLQAHRAELGRVRAVLPSPEAFATVLDKQATLQVAQDLGLSVPRSWQPTSLEEIDRTVAGFPLPAVLKWSDPNAVIADLESRNLDLIKAEYVHSAPALRSALLRYRELNRWPLVQQYCPGYGLGQFFYMRRGQVLRQFQHRRVAEWPPEGGFSSVCDAVSPSQHADVTAQSVALLRRIGWTGVAMVEYRFDPLTGTAWLMEVNGRFWGSYPLAYHCRAGFALLSYFDALGHSMPELPQPVLPMRCRMVATELKRLVRILLQPARIADPNFRCRPWWELGRFLWDFVRPDVRYYVWLAKDPKPWFTDLALVLRGLVRRH